MSLFISEPDYTRYESRIYNLGIEYEAKNPVKGIFRGVAFVDRVLHFHFRDKTCTAKYQELELECNLFRKNATDIEIKLHNPVEFYKIYYQVPEFRIDIDTVGDGCIHIENEKYYDPSGKLFADFSVDLS